MPRTNSSLATGTLRANTPDSPARSERRRAAWRQEIVRDVPADRVSEVARDPGERHIGLRATKILECGCRHLGLTRTQPQRTARGADPVLPTTAMYP